MESTVVTSIYENQRWDPLTGWGAGQLLPIDPKGWSDDSDNSCKQRPMGTHGWATVTQENDATNGWQYAFNFSAFGDFEQEWSRSKEKRSHFVRRRKWQSPGVAVRVNWRKEDQQGLPPAMLRAAYAHQQKLQTLKGYGPSKHEECGGKGMQLGKMVELGLPVPPFVTVPTGVYDECVQAQPELQVLIDGVIRGTGGEQELESIRKAILALQLPTTVKAELRGFLSSLPRGSAVSCRSSATGEDSADSSFAGQFDTELNITGAAAVEKAILVCWASLWKPHVLQYKSQMTNKDSQHMAVVVQLQIDSVASGVAFSCNPASGLENELVVEAVWGQGEGMVQGEITPDHFVIDTDRASDGDGGSGSQGEGEGEGEGEGRSGIASESTKDGESATGSGVLPLGTPRKILLQIIKVKREQFQLIRGGTAKVAVAPTAKQYKPCLTEPQLQQLASLCVLLKQHYQRPVDVEFATTKTGHVLMLQVRPVTAVAQVTVDSMGRPKRTLDWSFPLSPKLLRCNQQGTSSSSSGSSTLRRCT